MLILTQSDIDRFWSKVIVGETPDDCWGWDGSPNTDGYGQFWLSSLQRNEVASRVSYVIHYGQVPTGKKVLHTCNTRMCPNPNHLYAGTTQENTIDSVASGSWDGGFRAGSRHANARLTEAQVIEIRERHAHGQSNKYLALQFGVTAATISGIVLRTRWRHV